jgi:hypothetical protein
VRHALGLALLAALVSGSAALRIHLTLSDPNFDRESPAPLLKTDPALLYYITERIVEADGLVPDDFRADPRIEHPEGVDVPAVFTVGQEFFVAWCYRAFGAGVPLHVFSVWVMSVFASLVAVGVYGLTLELTRSVRFACLASLLWVVMLASYRTVGAILIREDFSFPWFALHAWWLARAARVGSAAAFSLAGLALLAAVATWHAMGFVVTMEVACLLAWFLRSGQNLPAAGLAWIALAVAGLGSLAVPVLRAKQFALSLPVSLALALVLGGRLARRARFTRRGETALVLGLALAGVALAGAAARETGAGLADYSHVFALLLAKLRHLGRLPEDPAALSFGARLLWEGPFETADPALFVGGFGTGLLVLAAGLAFFLPDWIRGRGDASGALVSGFSALALVASLLIQRTEILLSFAIPVVGALALQRLRPAWVGEAAMLAACAFPALALASLPDPLENAWYLPPEHNRELAEMKRWVAEHVPAGEPVAADLLTSAAILSHSRHPILVQPKYEARRSRERIEAFYTAFFHGSPADLRAWLLGMGARTLVIDRHFLRGEAYIAGVPPAQLDARTATAAFAFLHADPRVFAAIPGFRLLYRSPPELRYDSYRIYRLE